MKRTENYIWNLFFVLMGILSIGFVSILYLDYKHIVKKVTFELETNTQLVANSIDYKFAAQNLLLESIGRKLLKSKKTKSQKEKYLDSVLKKHPALIGFGLLDTNGNFLVTSSNVHVPEHANLIKNKSIEYYFKKTLESHDMVLGKTTYFKALSEWVIPIRKAIRDENGKVLAVMAAGILNGKNQNFIDQFNVLDKYNILIVKDKNEHEGYFRQYISGKEEISEDILYLRPIEEKIITYLKNMLYHKYLLTLDEIKTKKDIVSFQLVNILGEDQYGAMVYNAKYQLWIAVEKDYRSIQEMLLRNAVIYFSILILVFFLLLWLFKRLAESEIKSKNDLIFQAEHDELTHLPNRKYMYENIESWKRINAQEFYVLYLDLDNFKNINDHFGHTVGDRILKEVANRLRGFFSSSDMLVRQGGDEFIVFLTKEYREQLDSLCKSLISIISDLYIVDAHEFRIGMSIGISSYPKDSKDINELLSFADTAMYKAKQHKNYYAYFSEDMRHENILKSDIEHELRGAMNSEEFFMVYQPQVNLQGETCGVEALVRWDNKTLGTIRPDIFIEVAEQTGMMDELGDFIIRRSLHEIKQVQEQLNIEFSLSINISVVQFVEDDFLEKLMGMIKEQNFNKKLLILEVTESLSISDFDKIIPLLDSMKKEGIGVSLDDFGTGYSSLISLRKLPISELKVDKSFIDEIVYDMSERKLVQSIIEIGKNFEMETVAEGVENREQVEILKDLGCDIIQGYYYSKPLLLEQLRHYLKKEHIC
jgi:diguanylate cyclase (GGDEF)-like protein